MAEALGVVASGISVGQLAGQIVVTTIKIKQLYDKAKESSETIEYLTEQINSIAAFLGDPDDEFLVLGLPEMSPASRRLIETKQRCKDIIDRLEAIVSELSVAFDDPRRRKRGMAALKVVLKEDVLKKHELRLSHAVKMLELAQQCYIMALQRVNVDISLSTKRHLELASENKNEISEINVIKDRDIIPYKPRSVQKKLQTKNYTPWPTRALSGSITLYTGSVEVILPAENDDDDKTMNKTSRPKSEARLKLRVILPRWLSYKTHQYVLRRTYSGWVHEFTVSNVFNHSSPIWNQALSHIRSGEVDLLRRLFEERKIGPKDRDQCGNGLFTYALNLRRWYVCKMLLDHGAEADSPYYMTPMEIEGRNRTVIIDMGPDVFAKLCAGTVPTNDSALFTYPKLLGDEVEIKHNSRMEASKLFEEVRTQFLDETDLEDTPMALACCNGLMSEIIFRLKTHDDTGHDYLFETLFTLGKYLDSSNDANFTAWFSCDLKYYWASKVQFLWVNMHQTPRDFGDFCHETCRKLLKEHVLPLYFETSINSPPVLWSLLLYTSYPRRNSSSQRWISGVEVLVYLWLDDLVRMGIVLEKYGHMERVRLTSYGGAQEFLLDPYGPTDSCKIRLIDIQCGSTPQDWKLWWSEPTDKFAGDFWRLIEDPPLNIPGAWVE